MCHLGYRERTGQPGQPIETLADLVTYKDVMIHPSVFQPSSCISSIYCDDIYDLAQKTRLCLCLCLCVVLIGTNNQGKRGSAVERTA